MPLFSIKNVAACPSSPLSAAISFAMQTYECGICSEDFSQEKPHLADGTPVCDDCTISELVPRFHEALEHETSYPPPWGNASLDVAEFEDVLGPIFVREYLYQARLYAVPPKLRRYCKHVNVGNVLCNTMLLPPRPEKPANGGKLVCSNCQGESCAKCERPLAPGTTHQCTAADLTAENEEAFKDLRRGQDYQICPNPECGLPVELSAACNHMTCARFGCKTEFCFVCGQKTSGVGHWRTGMPCPLYGQPGPNNNHNQDQPVEHIPADRIAAMEEEPEFNFMDDSLTRVEEALGIFVDRADRRAHIYHFNTIPAVVLLERSENPEYWGNIMINSSLFCSKLADKMIEEDGYVPAWITRAINNNEDSRLAFAVSFQDPGVRDVVSRVQLLQHILHTFHRRGDGGWLDFSNKIGDY
ncbi:hypothetical protein HII31_00436 [Pseudocercospora fuligena]|uniref:RBR-type E3 ubiquitin transferase n=1 Tax=Pseudocercospora fuligena TaxID=685502 RepID=A0A8H6VTD0_9PEZI|nr:hypothetical protein HII31_00436 [Pseudocercospora fuligena]